MDTDLADPLLAAAKEYFGIDYLFPYQRLVVSNVLEGRSQIVVLPTGAGKSFCFLLPSALLDGLTLVVYPLRSLIADQARRLSMGSVAAESLTGETPRSRRAEIFKRCRSGDIRVLLTNPEMLIQKSIRDEISNCDVAHLVIDEAHVLPEWGDTFRPAYLEFARTAPELGARVTSAFTATASPEITKRLIALLFPDGPPHRVQGIPDRPNIHYSVSPILSVRHALTNLARTAERPMLVFCRSRAGAELTARALIEDTGDRRVRFYHAGLGPKEKTAIESWFFSASDAVLASTCAYGMGVDKPDIRTVVHLEAPESVEAYLQETGRAGRDGTPSRAVALASLDEIGRRISGSERRDHMTRYLRGRTECRRAFLLSRLGAPEVDCSGCDVCDGRVTVEARHLFGTLLFFAAHSHRFGRKEAGQALIKRLRGMSGEEWNHEETAEIIASLGATGLVTSPNTWLGRKIYGRELMLRGKGWHRMMLG